MARIARRRVRGQRSRAATAWPTPTAIDAGVVMRHALRLPTFLTLLLATAAVNKHEDPHEHAAALKKRRKGSGSSVVLEAIANNAAKAPKSKGPQI